MNGFRKPAKHDPVPDFALSKQAILDIEKLAEASYGQGHVADYIPPLREIIPHQFGLAIAHCNGETQACGLADVRFSIQSISKLFALTLALRLAAPDIWKRVKRDPCMGRFNSVSDVETNAGVPSNPFVNAGAIVVSDAIVSRSSAPNRIVLDFMRKLSGQGDIHSNENVASGESEVGNRNFALAYLLKDYGNIHNKVDDVLSFYFNSCAIEMSCKELARAALFLANDGQAPGTGYQVVSPEEARELNALLTTCGMYAGSGEFAFRIGIPAKSGVGGGILAIVPQRMAICVWSPELDTNGNSIVGQSILSYLVQKMGISIF